MKRGQRVLIHAGSGGVGTFAIQLAKHVGATVATTTSTANGDLVRRLGADIVIDYKKDDFADVLRDYDVVLNSLDKVTLEKSLRVLKPGGHLISISGPPDLAFARSLRVSRPLGMIFGVLSCGIRARAKRRQAHYSFLFMRANGEQLSKITALINDVAIRPVVDRVFPFTATKDSMAYVEAGRAKGKVVVSIIGRTCRPVPSPLAERSSRTANSEPTIPAPSHLRKGLDAGSAHEWLSRLRCACSPSGATLR